MLRVLVVVGLMSGCAPHEPATPSKALPGACQLAYVPACESATTRAGARFLGRLRLPVFHCDDNDLPLDASTLFESNETLAPMTF